ncbi:hypothetical protein C5952_02975 [Cronobacter sakazakii]|uniref:hypothetical protein n=1 Tax=Enterobacteriaceae TaxID=543 RepID=UPI0009B94A1C|nr:MULTISPECIES: hypothetical protein [Cronobacter]EBM7745629.1 hypothetical protein [Salmonella enterica subsp. enterica serovar Kentucky]EHR9796278.1 hypothetical protein [Salmonella enterica]ECU5713592.1 hypothetical protein [Salmonella enterica subsp. enterica serovar Kentucky]EDZ9411645.1 hypothetical protein [Salmonella enterica subsp. enterica serovar Kentucky]EEC5048859.1 hypothetical protein [Salmonella enterica subsp. enterica serovar Kentucky]
MLKSIINGGATTPTMLAKEIVFCHGEHAVVALRSILGTAGISATEREYALLSEQVVKILARIAKHLNHDLINFDEAAASKRINETKGI